MPSVSDLQGRICLVTGSSRGIGRALASALAGAGGTVIINGRDAARAADTAETLTQQGLQAHAAAFDITASADIETHIARIEDSIGPVDVLVNNAGMTVRSPASDFSPKDWRRIMDLNLDAAFELSQVMGRRMIERGGGKIIFTGSLMSEGARPGTAAYAVSKGGIRMMIKALAVEWAGHNIQVNGIGPGYIETDLTRPLMADPEFDAWVKKRTPAGRWGKPEDLGGAAVFLASSMSDFVNGQIIYVDGGWLAGF